jgi:hypothetical protein
MSAELPRQNRTLRPDAFAAGAFLLVVVGIIAVLWLHPGWPPTQLQRILVSWWSQQFMWLVLLPTLFLWRGRPWVVGIALTVVVLSCVWHLASSQLYQEQGRALRFEEISFRLSDPASRPFVYEKLLSLSAIAGVLMLALAAGGFWWLFRRLHPAWSWSLLLLLTPVMVFGNHLAWTVSELCGSHRVCLFANVCAPYSLAHRDSASFSICDDKAAQAYWRRLDTPFWEPQPDPILSPLQGRYPGRSILVVLLESHRLADVQALGDGAHGRRPSSPYLYSLLSKGLFFSEIHQGGYTTESMRWEMLTGDQYFMSSYRAPFLVKRGRIPDFNKAGYVCEWYQAADRTFSDFHTLCDPVNVRVGPDVKIPKNAKERFWNSWGMPDQELFPLVADNLRKRRNLGQPHLQFVLSIGSHDPYTFPDQLEGEKLTQDHSGGMRWTDRCLEDFLPSILQLPEKDRPIIFIVADHGHREGLGALPPYYQDSLEGTRLPGLLILPDGLLAGQRNATPFTNADALDLMAMMTIPLPSSDPTSGKFIRYRRTASAFYGEGFTIITPKAYMNASRGYSAQIKNYWQLVASPPDDLAQRCSLYLDEMTSAMWPAFVQ